MFNKASSKRAQTGETITWIVATVIIIIVLAISIYIAGFYLGNNKNVRVSLAPDFSVSGSFFSYLLTEGSGGETVYSQIQKQGNLNSLTGQLAVNVSDYAVKNYDTVWIGVVDSRNVFPPVANDYFSTLKSLGEFPYRHEGTIIEEAQLDGNKNISLVMVEKFK